MVSMVHFANETVETGETDENVFIERGLDSLNRDLETDERWPAPPSSCSYLWLESRLSKQLFHCPLTMRVL